jgi:hypothetical protein
VAEESPAAETAVHPPGTPLSPLAVDETVEEPTVIDVVEASLLRLRIHADRTLSWGLSGYRLPTIAHPS